MLVNDKNRVTLDLAPAKATLILESDPANPAARRTTRRDRRRKQQRIAAAAATLELVEITGTIGQGETLPVKSVTGKIARAKMSSKP